MELITTNQERTNSMSTQKVKAKDLQLGRNYTGIVTDYGDHEVYGSYDSDSNRVTGLKLWTKRDTSKYGNSIEMVTVTYWDHIDGECEYNFPSYTEFTEVESIWV